jgi:hypothetical protein
MFKSMINLFFFKGFPACTGARHARLRVGSPVVLAALLLGLCGCAQLSSTRGVEVGWAPAQLGALERGRTTRGEVLERLGPPSQVIAVGDETVLYYMNERARGQGLVLVLYNRLDVDTRYDRAIFFFDADDRLSDHSVWVRQPE